jgi:hypothetical protein
MPESDWRARPRSISPRASAEGGLRCLRRAAASAIGTFTAAMPEPALVSAMAIDEGRFIPGTLIAGRYRVVGSIGSVLMAALRAAAGCLRLEIQRA